MKSIISYQDRGNFGNSSYRGNFSGRMLEELHDFYKFDTISDYSCGSNTTGDFALSRGINKNCYDLNMGFDLIDNPIKERNNFIIYHPSYWDIIKYSGVQYGDAPHPHDLSHIKDYREFIRAYDYTVAKQFSSLKTGGRLCILMGDIKKNKKLYSMLLDMAKIGTIENIVIKAQHNCLSNNKSYANENFIRIVHEYLLILRKDNPYTYEMMITNNMCFDIRDDNFKDYKISWKDLVAAALEKLGGKAILADIYKEIEGHKKADNNNHWKEKIRQTLQIHPNIFKNIDRGYWKQVA